MRTVKRAPGYEICKIDENGAESMKIKRNICLMYGISLLQGMVFYGPIATLYRQATGVTVFEITLIESISLALCKRYALN